ncbi:ferredoxin [Alcanivorax sp. P2S70]|uniref:ferredoxin reductase n=1 Tax=Alcanivorax sp. P2S70 TaxID=1397527 RepID=UPI0003B5800C|nr:ferredoxin reductase [Alcanivorax sp. P2S70]ERP92182.1 ferredoxin [Alcanivorax sp. P2S70]
MRQPTQPVPGGSPSIWSRLSTLTDYFAWPLRTSHYLELVNPLWTTHKMQARVVKVWDETRDARTLTLRPGLNWRGHRAGQHVRVGIPANGKHYTRTYTISSAPERYDDCFTITVKAIDKGTISHHIVRNIQVGDYLPIGLPQGDFYLPDAQHIHPLFITAGSGITPAFSMVNSLIAQERLPDTCHLHYAPHEFDVVLGKQLREMAAQYDRYHLHLLYTREENHPGNARFSAAQLDALCPDWKERDVYACGPPSLLEAVEQCFEQAGCSRNLHIERFRAPFTEIPADAVGGKVRFAQSGVDAEGDSDTPLLKVAEEAGMNPPHGCRMGICHTCNTTLVSGCVRDLRTGEVLNEAGSIVQTCICAAAGDCELDL